MGRKIENFFEGAAETNGGIVAGLSRTWYGQGDVELVTLDNPSSAAVIMERREFGVDDAEWISAGGITRTSVHRLNLFSSGFEFRARLLENSPEQPLRLTTRTLDQIHRGLRQDILVEAFSSGNVVGFADPEAKGIIDYGDYEKLKSTTAFMFFCYDKDPVLLAKFGGAWEKYGVDYRKLHFNDVQFLLSVAIDDYVNNGNGNTGGNGGNTGGQTGGNGNEGEIGGPPAVQVGNPSLVSPPASSVNLEIYSSSLGEALWGDPIDENTAVDKYEVSLNGTIVYIGTANSKVVNNLSPSTQYTISIVRFRDDGTHAPPVTKSNATPAVGEAPGGTDTSGNPLPTSPDGTDTTYNFYRVDAHSRSYVESGAGSPAQVWQQETTLSGYTGAGYIRTSNINSASGQGATAFFLNQQADSLKDRRMWVRCRADTPGDQVGLCSHGGGSLSIATINSVDWIWIQLPQHWKVHDASLQILGISGGVSVDAVIAQDLDDTSVPTGEQGLKAA